MRAVDITQFDPRPRALDGRAPWLRLAEFVSLRLGRPVRPEDIELRAGDYARLHDATAVWLLLLGDRSDPFLLPHGHVARARTEYPGFAFVREEATP